MFKLPFVTAILSMLAIAAGAFLGIQSVKLEQKSELKTVAQYQKENNIVPDKELVLEKLPKAEIVGETDHDFGHIGYLETIRIEFKIKNAGGSALRIDQGETSCGQCTTIQIPTDNFPPGVKNPPESRSSLIVQPGAVASVFVVFTQKNKEYTPRVSHWAKFYVSDPIQKHFEFRITGNITKAYRLTADRFNLADITVGQGLESRIGVFGYGVEPLKLDRVEFLSEVRESDFAVKIEPMPEEKVKAEPGATSGYDIVLTAIKPPLGRISHQLRLHVANAEPPTLDIPIEGNVIGSIQIIAQISNPRIKWNRGLNYLDLGVVDGKTGEEATLQIRAKSPPDSPQIQFKVKEVFPDFLQAEIGESTRGSNAQIVPVKIRIPAGSKPVNFRSLSPDVKQAHVVIESNDPATPEIVIGVRFGIE